MKIKLRDTSIIDTITIQKDESIPLLNFNVLDFYGKADGSLLTRNYNVNSIANLYLRLISMHVSYYSDSSTWIKEAEYDNKTFTANANTRFKLLRNKSKLSIDFLSQLNDSANTGIIQILVNNNPANIFPSANLPAVENLNLDVLLGYPVQSGIDFKLTYSFYNDIDANTTLNPYVHVLLLVQTYLTNPTSIVTQNVQQS